MPFDFFVFVLDVNTKRHELKQGYLTGWFLIILFSLRFVDEFFKINQESFENDLPLNMGQMLSIPFVIIGMVILLSAGNREGINMAYPGDEPKP